MSVQEPQMMDLTLRPARPEDAPDCGRICYEAFLSIASRHNFPPDFPSAEVAQGLLSYLLSNPGFYSVVAERDGQVVGSNFLDERSSIAGVGPITVDPSVQDSGIGRRLMEAVLARAADRGFAGVRLLQSAYHARSLSLYTKLGFQVRDVLACMQGPAIGATIPGYAVRPAVEADLASGNRVCRLVHGHDRGGELLEAIKTGTATVVEHDGRISGYATTLAFFGHAVGGDGRRSQGPHWGGPHVRRTGHPRARTESSVRLVLGQEAPSRPTHDLNESWALQRAGGCFPAIRPVLKRGRSDPQPRLHASARPSTAR